MLLGAMSVAAIGFLIWLLFTLAVYALPFWAGLSSGMFAYKTGAGFIGAVAAGIVVAGLTLGIGEVVHARLRSPVAQGLFGLLFAAPAAVAGYYAAPGILKWSVTNEVWLVALSSLSAIAVSAVAWARLAVAPHVSPSDIGEPSLAAPPSGVPHYTRRNPARLGRARGHERP